MIDMTKMEVVVSVRRAKQRVDFLVAVCRFGPIRRFVEHHDRWFARWVANGVDVADVSVRAVRDVA